MLALRRHPPTLGRHDLFLAKGVGTLGAIEDAAAIDPGAEIGRHRDVGRGGHDMPGERVVTRRQRPEDAAESFLRRQPAAARRRNHGGDRDQWGTVPPRGTSPEGHLGQKRLQPLGRQVEPGETVPFGPREHRHAALEQRHLLRVHQAGVIVLVAGEGQVVALDRIGDEAGRLIVGDAVKGVEHRAHVVPGEIGH